MMAVIDRFTTLTTFCLLALLIPTSRSQLALASSSYLDPPNRASGIDIRDTSGDLPGIEKEIAAIFKGVAYGTTSTSTSTTTTTTTTTTRPPPPPPFTDSGLFIGKQKTVRINVDLVPDKDTYSIPYSETTVETKRNEVSVPTVFYRFPDSGVSDIPESYKSRIVSVPSHVTRTSAKPFTQDDEPAAQVKNQSDEDVSVSGFPKRKGYSAIQFHIQNAWDFHVYITGIIFCFLVLLSLAFLCRINTCSHLIPRGYCITINLMIFISSFFRALLFLHDPYGAMERLPPTLNSVLYNTVYPCLNTAFGVMLLVIIRAGRVHVFPVKVQSPLLLGILCGLHIGASVIVDVLLGYVSDPKSTFVTRVVIQSVSSLWGAILCVIYVFSYSSVEKAATRQRNGDLGTLDKNPIPGAARPSLTCSSRIFMLCCLFNALLIAFAILNMVTQKVPVSPTENESWAWLTQSSLERVIEIVLSFLLLWSAFSLTQGKQKGKSDDRIFSLFRNCRSTNNPKTIGVYPVVSEKCNILSNGSLISSSPNSSMNYSMNGWKKSLKNEHLAKTDSISSPITKIMYPTDPKHNYVPRLISTPDQTCCTVYNDQKHWEHPNEFKYYPHLQAEKTLPNMSINTGQNLTPGCYVTTAPSNIYTTYCQNDRNSCSSRSPIYHRAENEYEVASYYSNSNSSTATNIYSKPYPYYTYGQCQPCHVEHPQIHSVPSCRPEQEIKTGNSACSSHSEIHVDYLTDASSIDGLQSSLSRSRTLPVCMQDQLPDPSKHRPPPAIPDNADRVAGPIDLLKISSNSLNDVLKSQTNFFGKIVSGSNNSTGYTPLSLDDGTVPSDKNQSNYPKSTQDNDLECDVIGV